MLYSISSLFTPNPFKKNSRENYREMAPPTQSNGNTESHVKIPEIKFTKLFINGEFVDSLSGKTFESIDPRNEEVIARVAEGDKEDVDLAVKAARQAFDNGPWPRFSGTERRRILLKLADLIEENAEEIAVLETLDAGKLFSEGKYRNAPAAAGTFRYYAGAADKIHGTTLKMSRDLQGYTLREPIGVVGLIIPWNFPGQMFAFKVAPALAAGCTVVVKPAEQTPLSALLFAHLAKLAGVPDGVVNVITGFGPTAGAAISSHMDIDKVSFTGSTEVGRLIMQAAATSNLKPVSLELGGKSPFIVFDDVDVDKVSDLALAGVTYNKGEVCAAGSRVFVQEGIYDKFVEKVVAKAKARVIGDPFDPNVQQGPQADINQYEKILSYIEHGKREGATLLTGGKPLDRKGYFIEPTIFTDVTDDMLIAKDEIFGPVMPILKFKTVEEVIKRANDTKYGLAAGIMTNDWNIANTVSRSIRAGIIWINCYLAFDADCPFGGYKMSGFDKDMGMEGLYKYLQLKSVATPVYNSPWL
ncbi:PREDICTED: aldehyde dehydrogenase family 2 member C4-like [Ipomoea nil]|uniref:aldehyde dehydrogenase family 2 member C4-like n=1 Tax=Ipomoea nil TaxID=35883 RepID=UPI000901E731|nr:PREDICTED: aldehyde dehydrogenase family 2 member C4-like [Ipomoea nil]